MSIRIIAVLLASAVMLSFVSPASASFHSNGVETFPGTQLDSQSWATSGPATENSGLSFQQNDGVTIHAYQPTLPTGGYTTTSPLVPVGGGTWAEVKVNISGPTDQV